MNDLYWMQQAYQQALLAQAQGEVPVGAVLISSEQQLLSTAHNQVISRNDPCAHAEILAVREAAQKLSDYRLVNTTLYVTLEPCAMCAGALVHARVARLVFATRDFKAGAAGSVCNLLKGHPFNHQIHIDEGPLQQESAQILKDFFSERR